MGTAIVAVFAETFFGVAGNTSLRAIILFRSQASLFLYHQVSNCVVNRSVENFAHSLVWLGQPLTISELDITGGDERRVGYYAG